MCVCVCVCVRARAFGFHTYILGIDLTLKCVKEGRKCCYLTTPSTHFIYGYMASDIWLRIILIVRKATLYD